MMSLLQIGEGPRDEAAIPPLVEKFLNHPISTTFRRWTSVEVRAHGKGLTRKLMYMLRQAHQQGFDAVVATVDVDKSPPRERLGQLQTARDEFKQKFASPLVAVGVADPHLEAWLLDDEAAVRKVLGLPGAIPIPAVSKVEDPKGELNHLHQASQRAQDKATDILSEIAGELNLNRCNHAKSTGLYDFREDVQREIVPLK